jgi:hypothetical protein
MREPFDIRDTRNVYQPCPLCGVTHGLCLMLGNKNATIAVQCTNCDFRGPEVPAVLDSLMTMDRQAFEAWNALDRTRGRTPHVCTACGLAGRLHCALCTQCT